MLGGHDGRNLRCQVIQLDGGDTRIQPTNDLESDGWRIDVIHVKAIAEFLDSRGDLVKVNRLFAAVTLADEHTILAIFDHGVAGLGFKVEL